jgi:iron complex transport system permease protein
VTVDTTTREPAVDPRPAGATSVRLGGLSWLLPRRAAVVAGLGLVVLCVVASLDLALGDFQIPVVKVVRILLTGEGESYQRVIVLDVRLPQTTLAIAVGAALGLAGALTQTFARNPLASPDILGVTEGAALCAVAFIVFSGINGSSVASSMQALGVTGSAFVGGMLTAFLLFALAWRRGIEGNRLVLIGIGLGAAFAAGTSWLLVTARLEDQVTAQVWLTGSLTNSSWSLARPVIVALLVLVPLTLLLVRVLNALQLGDDNARGLGVRLQGAQLVVLLCAVALASVAVSAVGPLDFVALVVPQVAVRLTGGSRPPLVTSMILGAVLVVSADLVTRTVLPFGLPAGIVTAAIGAPYLIWLLLRSKRKVSV